MLCHEQEMLHSMSEEDINRTKQYDLQHVEKTLEAMCLVYVDGDSVVSGFDNIVVHMSYRVMCVVYVLCCTCAFVVLYVCMCCVVHVHLLCCTCVYVVLCCACAFVVLCHVYMYVLW